MASPPLAAPRAAPVFASRHFRAEREGDWARLEQLLDKVEKRSARRLSEEDLVELPRLYRATLSALSVARETSLDAAMIAYLESLSTRAYFVIYGCREPWLRQIGGFFRRGWPRAVRAIAPEIALMAALFIASAVAGYFLVSGQPGWYDAIMPPEMAAGRDMGASTAFLRDTLYGKQDREGLDVFATFLFTHNAGVSILAFALGFAFAIPTLFLVADNGVMLGAFYAVYVPHGLAFGLTGWLMIHGTTELSAIVLAGAAGLHIGRAVAFPGERSRLAAAGDAGKRAGMVMMGVVVMLFFAGLLEGFGRQLITDDYARLTIAAGMFTLWVSYFGLVGREARDGAA